MVKKAQSSVDSLIKGIDFLVLKKHKLDRRTRIFCFLILTKKVPAIWNSSSWNYQLNLTMRGIAMALFLKTFRPSF